MTIQNGPSDWRSRDSGILCAPERGGWFLRHTNMRHIGQWIVDMLAIPPAYLRTGPAGFAVERLGAGHPVLLSQPLHQTPLFRHLERGLAVLRRLAFPGPELSKRGRAAAAGDVAAMVPELQRCLSFVGQCLIFGHRGQPAAHRAVRRLSFHLELCGVFPSAGPLVGQRAGVRADGCGEHDLRRGVFQSCGARRALSGRVCCPWGFFCGDYT